MRRRAPLAVGWRRLGPERRLERGKVPLDRGAPGSAEEIDLVLLSMNQKGAEKLMEDKVSLGGDASVAAGPVGRAATAGTDVQFRAEILSYSKSRGVFAGIDLSGGMLGPDKDANVDVYGAPVVPQTLLTSPAVKAPAAASSLLAALRSETRSATTSR